MVLGALTCAAGNHQHVVTARGICQSASRTRSASIRQDAEIHRLRTRDLDQPLQHRRIGVIDLAWHEWIARAQDLVAGRDDGDLERGVAAKPV